MANHPVEKGLNPNTFLVVRQILTSINVTCQAGFWIRFGKELADTNTGCSTIDDDGYEGYLHTLVCDELDIKNVGAPNK